jgi:YhcH/YjgK/YiaL family protein
MIIDSLANCDRYASVHPRIEEAFRYLQETDLVSIPVGKYPIDGTDIFAIVQEYDTMDAANEQMESHRKYVDVQFVADGAELVGHALLAGQTISKPYSDEEDYMLYADKPVFFTKMTAGTFMVFFPTDLHMPCIKVAASARVKKVVVKVAV